MEGDRRWEEAGKGELDKGDAGLEGSVGDLVLEAELLR